MALLRKPAWRGEYLPFGAVGMTVAPVRALRSGRIVSANRRGLSDIPIVDAYASPSECNSYGSWAVTPGCWGHSVPYWQTMASAIGAPPSPTIVPGTVSTLPAGTQDNAQTTVNALLDQQMQAQQAVNAAGVDSTLWDLTQGGLYQAGSAVSGVASIPWWVWAGGGLAAAFIFFRGWR